MERRGHAFWGNVPPFTPAADPAGTVYQRHGGDRGHEIGVVDATPEVRALLTQRLHELPATATPFIVNKNPYNVVRLPWLRALFPDARIVAMIRQPVPNVFSLLKKKRLDKGRDLPHLAPDERWWGVKPAGWRNHIADDVVELCAWQWSAAARKLHDDRRCADAVVAYHELCRNPTPIIERILGCALAEPLKSAYCFDDEFATGSQLLSKNQMSMKSIAHGPSHDEPIELSALDSSSVATIERVCRDAEALFPELM